MKIRTYKKSDAHAVASLVRRTYKKFNHSEGSKRAVQSYIDHFNTNNFDILLRQFARSAIFYVATDDQKIVGMVRGNPNKVTNLFVDGTHHGKGVGRKLMNAFEAAARKKGSSLIKIRASLYATPFYTKLGYKKTTGVRTFHGLKIQPMKKVLDEQST